MNGLTLRINPSNPKNKNLISFGPVNLPSSEILENENIVYKNFSNASTVDEQLEILKSIFYSGTSNHDPNFIKFLAIVFLHAEVKHPIKCFLTRHVTKNEMLQQPFSEKLSHYIKEYMMVRGSDYHSYIGTVSKVATCIENFPAGAAAVKLVEIELSEYMKASLECCVATLSKSTSLSPTEKNEIFNLAHLSLRLLHYIVQKVNQNNTATLISKFKDLRLSIKCIFFDEDAPMDTKTISGILYLCMEIFENGPSSWLKILDRTQADSYVDELLSNESAKLALLSAIATVVSAEKLQSHQINEKSSLIILTQHVISIGERNSSESIFTLGITRTILLISKMLNKVSDNCLGQELVDCLLVFVWGHLEHYMDSVRHLAAQALNNIVRYCTRVEKEGDAEILNRLLWALNTLDRSRKSYYVSLCSLITQLGATRVMELLPDIINDVIKALHLQAVQASATTTLETLLEKHARQTNTQSLYKQWIVPILQHVGSNALDSSVLNILENLMASFVVFDENIFNYILPHIRESCNQTSTPGNLKCILLLLCVARKSGVISKLSTEWKEDEWKGVISYGILKMAAIDIVEETRILSLSLVCESPKSTEVFAPGDLDFVLWYLRYNINAQSPNFRQLTLSVMKKFSKRFEESYKVLKRQKELNLYADKGDFYLTFIERLRTLCFDSLLPGVNYSRRFVALQMLAWFDDMDLEGYQREWKKDYVEKLLLHLEDSYENNKALALCVLDKCPRELVETKKYRVSIEIEDILRQASSMKPTDCVSAAYKLMFLKQKLPEAILRNTNNEIPDAVSYSLLRTLSSRLRGQLSTCGHSIVAAARDAPMYGLLHCMVHVLQHVDHSAIAADQEWKTLIEEVIQTCISVNASVSCVVNNSSPEGHLPMDAGGVAVNDYGNTGDVRLDDGRPVTAQMVLLCAWRSVKEVSLLLGTISLHLSIEGEGQEYGTLSHQQLTLIGEHFTTLLAETKHRGAFEQAYVGFTKLLTRLWRCRSPVLHGRPRMWLRRLTGAVASPQASATRRSAGLPFMIQALVTTELQVEGNPKCLHEIMTTLLKLAQRKDASQYDVQIETTFEESQKDSEFFEDSQCNYEPHSKISLDSMSTENLVESRTHSLNILRALFRNSALEESVSGYVGQGLMVALAGFEGDTWMERNSATLLFSALMVRVFGVWRPRASDRNRMTGRIFFLRYPALYDFILDRLRRAQGAGQAAEAVRAQGALLPLLLLLARLRPAGADGAASCLRLAALAPLVARAAAARALAARRLAAAALLPLLPPRRYIPHIESMLSIIADPTIKRNYCHGVLLQLAKLLASKPDNLTIEEDVNQRVMETIKNTYWILQQCTGDIPCYMITDEYVKIINLMIWHFPTFIEPGMLRTIKQYVDKILFTETVPLIKSGRDVCISNVMYLNIVITNIIATPDDVRYIIFKGLEHKSYDVVLSTLNYLLILYGNIDTDNCQFLEHLATIPNDNTLEVLRKNHDYIQEVCKIMKNNKYLECVQKALKVLSLEGDTQKYIVALKLNKNATEISDEEVVRTLFDCIHNEHENVKHIYLESLSNFVSDKLEGSNLSDATVMDVIRMIYACSSSENSDSMRSVVAGFLERNFSTLMRRHLENFNDKDKFEFRSTLLATTVTTLEDDEESIRQRVSAAVSGHAAASGPTAVCGHAAVSGPTLAARAGEALRAQLAGAGAAGDAAGQAGDAAGEAGDAAGQAGDAAGEAGDAAGQAGDAAGEAGDAAALLLLALLDFRSEVCITDEISDECRVFDQNERHNIYLEETVWTIECAREFIRLNKDEGNLVELVQTIIENPVFADTFDKLCHNNLIVLKKMLTDNNVTHKYDILNPKIELLINRLLEK